MPSTSLSVRHPFLKLWHRTRFRFLSPLVKRRHSNGTLSALLIWIGLFGLVAYAALITHRHYVSHLDLRWSSIYHDRNAHYQAALCVACELRQGHIGRTLLDLDAASVAWPILHPLLLGLILTVVGPIPEVAVLPSLGGWMLAAILAFWLVRQLGGPYGAIGGLLTVSLFLTSPALRVMATDVMLESLGLGLTLTAVVAYAAWVQHPTSKHACWLGASLSALFLHKYNYWGLVVFSLGIHEAIRHRKIILQFTIQILSHIMCKKFLVGQSKNLVNYLILSLLIFSLIIVYHDGISMTIFGHRIGMKKPRLLIQLAYILSLIRLGMWWGTRGRYTVEQQYGFALRKLLEWAAIPPLLWLALPFRLQFFVWYAGPGNDPGILHHTFWQKCHYYFDCIYNNYFIHQWISITSCILTTMGILYFIIGINKNSWKWIIPLLFIISCILTLSHPNEQMRFVHTWFPLFWLMSGIGFAALINGIIRRIPPFTKPILVSATVLLIIGGILAGMSEPPRVQPEFGRGYGNPSYSLRPLYNAYLSHLSGQEETAILCNLPEASWRWPFLERFGHKNGLRHNLREIGCFDPVSLADARRWLAVTTSQTIVYVEIPPHSPLYEPPPQGRDNSAIKVALLEQDRFQQTHSVTLPHVGAVSIWRR